LLVRSVMPITKRLGAPSIGARPSSARTTAISVPSSRYLDVNTVYFVWGEIFCMG